MEIIKQRDMGLLSRKRYTIMVDHQGATPSRKEMIKQVSKELKVKDEQVVIKHVYSQFGKNKTKLIVHVYDDPSKKSMFESENLLKKHPQEEKAEKEEKKSEDKKESKEEKSEDKKESKEEKSEDKKESKEEKSEKKEEKSEDKKESKEETASEKGDK